MQGGKVIVELLWPKYLRNLISFATIEYTFIGQCRGVWSLSIAQNDQ